VLYASLANSIFNIPRAIDVPVYTASGQADTMRIPPGFYTPSDIAAVVRLNLGDVVSAAEGKLVWNLGSIQINGGATGIPALGISSAVVTGSFETTPVLSAPSCVGICIRELDAIFCVTTGSVPCRPTVVLPLVNGHGMFETYEPKQPQTYQCNVQALSTLTVEIRDMASGQILDSVDSFAMEILCN
jgi:hypothetical protein